MTGQQSEEPAVGPGAIVLAHEPVRRLGPLTIDPPHRLIAHDDGREEYLEPRVMQVLVALLRADGSILSRDDLAFCCWEGRIVGDDSINRVLSRLRRTADGIGHGIFRIETLTKVGYRLVGPGGDHSGPLPAAVAAGRPERVSPSRWPAIGALVLLLLLAAALLALGPMWVGSNKVPTLALLGESGGAVGELADDLAGDLSRFAAARAGDLAIVDAARAGNADYVMRIASRPVGRELDIRLTLLDRRGELLWSAHFRRPPDRIADLREQIGVKLGDVLLCTLRGSGGKGERLDTVTLRLFLAACDGRTDGVDDNDLRLLRQVAARAPRFARGWAMLAASQAQLGSTLPGIGHSTFVARSAPGPGVARGPEDERMRRTLRQRAREDLERARALDPHVAEGFLAEAWLIDRPRAWLERLAIYDRGLAAVPDDSALHVYRTVDLLWVGRMSDAVASARHAVDLDPLSSNALNKLVSALAYAGQIEDARRELERGERTWPGSAAMSEARARFDSRFGDAANAMRLLSGSQANWLASGEMADVARAFAVARAEPTPANVDAAVGLFAKRPPRTPGGFRSHLQTLVYFGRVDEAYRLIGSAPAEVWTDADSLFRPYMRPLRLDRRFMAFARDIGLLDYWRSSGHWPDFCSDRALPYDCKAVAGRLAGERR